MLTEHISSYILYVNVLASELSHVRVQLRFQIRTYIYVVVRQVICACSVVRHVGGVKC